MKESELSFLSSEERSKIILKMKCVLKKLEELETDVESLENKDTFAGCSCSCDCDPWDPATTKASFHFGVNFANLGG